MGTKVKYGTRRRYKGLSPSERYYRLQFRLLMAQMNAYNHDAGQSQNPSVESPQHLSVKHELWQAECIAHQAAWEAKREAWRAESEAHHAKFRAAMDRFNAYMDTHFLL